MRGSRPGTVLGALDRSSGSAKDDPLTSEQYRGYRSRDHNSRLRWRICWCGWDSRDKYAARSRMRRSRDCSSRSVGTRLLAPKFSERALGWRAGVWKPPVNCGKPFDLRLRDERCGNKGSLAVPTLTLGLQVSNPPQQKSAQAQPTSARTKTLGGGITVGYSAKLCQSTTCK
jgi:hypothetical protein